MKSFFQQVTIIAPGLLGGSLGLAIKKKKLARKVVVWARRIERAQAAVRKKAADSYKAEIGEAVRGSDLVILCSPVEAMADLAKQFKNDLKKTAIVTDVGSVKYDVVSHLSQIIGKKAVFIGSHPMAGSENSGLGAAKANLFEKSVCLLTPLPATSRTALHKLIKFWETVGCSIATLSPAEHDEVVARISHLPHLVSAMLLTSAGKKNSKLFEYIGPGFRDMTRIAGGPPDMWSEICIANHVEIRRALDELIEQLESVRRSLANKNTVELRSFLRRAKSLKDDIT